MPIPLSVSIFRCKRNEIRDTVAIYQEKLNQVQADLAHVLAALRVFEASGRPEDVTPKVDLNRLLVRRETTKLCFAVLEAQGPLDTQQRTDAAALGATLASLFDEIA